MSWRSPHEASDPARSARRPATHSPGGPPMTPDDVLQQIDPEEVVELALALGNIDSPTGGEGPAGAFVQEWLTANGFAPRRFALTEDRFNVAAWIDGSGG